MWKGTISCKEIREGHFEELSFAHNLSEVLTEASKSIDFRGSALWADGMAKVKVMRRA